MRLICTISQTESQENPFEFSFYLSSQGVDNECEEVSVDNKNVYRIWVYDEDHTDQALSIYEAYQKDPTNPMYRAHYERAQQAAEAQAHQELLDAPPPKRRGRFLSPVPYGAISILILFVVVGLFFWVQIERSNVIPPKIPGVIQAPVLAPIEKNLVFDYPVYFTMRDKLLNLYTPQDIEEKKPPSPEAKELIQKLQQTPTWMGMYDRIVLFLQKKPIPINYQGTPFEDVSKGEVWRLFTPTLLHFDFLHIFFNILWFILLGNQIEYRIGAIRFTLMVLIIGILSNIAQYLVSGPFFMGLSGVVCGMAAFIWARQQVAPWEGYLLHRFTLIFLGIFVIGMFVLQLVFFFMQIFGKFDLTVGIANTAHLIGALFGYLMGRMRRSFAIRKKAV